MMIKIVTHQAAPGPGAAAAASDSAAASRDYGRESGSALRALRSIAERGLQILVIYGFTII